MHVRIAFMAKNGEVSDSFVDELLLSTQYKVDVTTHTKVDDETLGTINVLDLDVAYTDLFEFMKYTTNVGGVLSSHMYDEYMDWLEQFAGVVYPDHYESIVMVPENATSEEWAQLVRWMSLSHDVLKRTQMQSIEQIDTLNNAMQYCVNNINAMNQNIKNLNIRTGCLTTPGAENQILH